jgi:lipopolysaccharide export system protein LptC
MIGRQMPRALGAPASRWGAAQTAVAEWLANLPGNRYSRRVALLKMALPAIGLALLLLVVAWPRLAPLFDRLRFPAIDLREARELRMLNPRYAGTDRNGNPFVITAAVGRQVPERNDVMALDGPKADVKDHAGANIVVTADSGVYQTQAQFLDAFGNVTLTHQNGTVMTTASARLDVANNAAEGHDRVKAHGPNGDIVADGFRIIDKGKIVFFTGHADLLLKNTRAGSTAAAAAPAAASLPPPVAQAAAQLEQAATKPHPAPAARSTSAPAARSTSAPARAVKPSAAVKPAPTKKPT